MLHCRFSNPAMDKSSQNCQNFCCKKFQDFLENFHPPQPSHQFKQSNSAVTIYFHQAITAKDFHLKLIWKKRFQCKLHIGEKSWCTLGEKLHIGKKLHTGEKSCTLGRKAGAPAHTHVSPRREKSLTSGKGSSLYRFPFSCQIFLQFFRQRDSPLQL